MKPPSKCPHCAQSLQPFLVKAPSGAEVELSRCSRCGGFWSPEGRLQRTFGPAARHQLVGGMTQRHCVECRILMTPAVLPSGLSVEVCSACHGMFLDAGELEQLGARERQPGRAPARPGLPTPAAAPTEKPPGTFPCIECGQFKPLREGQALRDGLACRSCMKARAEGRDSEGFSLGSLLRGRPKP